MPFSLILLNKIKKNDPTVTDIELRSFPLLTDEDIAHLVEKAEKANNTYLKRLVLKGTLISEIGAEKLSRLSCLEKISLTQSKIGDKGAIFFANQSNAKYLNLSENGITDEGAISLARNKTLTSLSLIGNKISDKGAQEFLKNNTITDLSLQNNSISGDLLKKLEEHINNNVKRIKEEKQEIAIGLTDISSSSILMQKNNELPTEPREVKVSELASSNKKRPLDSNTQELPENSEEKIKNRGDTSILGRVSFYKYSQDSQENSTGKKRLKPETEKQLNILIKIIGNDTEECDVAVKIMQEHTQKKISHKNISS